MPNFNKVILAGNITRDPELRYTSNGTPVAEFTIAINRKYKDQEETSFIDCVAWMKTAEVICEYMKKGRPILVEGRLQQDTWEKDGQKRSKIKVVVEGFQFIGGGAKDDTGDRLRKTFGGDDPAPKKRPNLPEHDENPFPDEDVPF